MTVAVAGPDAASGITVAEVNLTRVRERIEKKDQADRVSTLVVDPDGYLIAHLDMNLVLRKTPLGTLPQFKAALTDSGPGTSNAPAWAIWVPSEGWVGRHAMISHSLTGQPVLTAWAPINPPGWYVFIEQPLDEALRPLSSTLVRSGVLLGVGLVLAVVASLILARSMVTPIQALRAGADRIGAGALGQRIEVRTGDELEVLADEFNDMAMRLQKSYGELNDRVREAVRDLEVKNQELEAARQAQEVFMGRMAHDLKTPLNSILPYTDALLDRAEGDLTAGQEKYLQRVRFAGETLLWLVDDLLNPVREPVLTQFDLPNALEFTVAMKEPMAQRKGVALELAVDPGVGDVVADEHQIRRVLYNLLDNALKFTPPGGHVSVAATSVKGEVRISIVDSGIGIPAAELSHIFKDGFQGMGGKESGQGKGQGLAIAEQYVEMHGGRIWAASNEGQGAAFTFTIPMTERGDAEDGQPDPADTSNSPGGARQPPLLSSKSTRR